MPVRIVRAVGAAALVAAAGIVLTSCSTLGLTPGSSVSTDPGPIVDPSIPDASPTETVPPATPTASPTASAPATPVATPTAGARTAVVPFITTADWDSGARALDVAALVTGVVEHDGTCTVTVSSGSVVRTATTPAVAASSYTGCQQVAVSGLTAGSWQVRVRYASATSAGTSAARTVRIG